MKFIILPGFTMDKKHKDIEYLMDKLKQTYPKSKSRCLNPPIRKTSLYKNKPYHSWYDYHTDHRLKEEEINKLHLLQSRKRIHKLLNSMGQINDIFLVGYSQGACMALDSGLTFPKRLGGIICFKGHVPSETFKDIRMQQPVWATHGGKDKTIGHLVAKKSYNKLKKCGCPVKFYSQPKVNHSIRSGINDELKQLVSLFKPT